MRNCEAAWKLAGASLVLAGLLFTPAASLRGDNGSTPADAPRFQNAKVETRALQGSLGDEVRRWAAAPSKARWLGYSVPAVNGENMICCSNYSGHSDHDCLACSLEGNNDVTISGPKEPSKIELEGPGKMAVLLRADGGKIVKIREFSTDCAVDAGGLEVLWLEGVAPGESVSLLQSFVLQDRSAENESLGKSALVAIALHGDASADRALESFVAPEQPEELRKQTAFWLGAARGSAGFRVLQNMAQNDPSSRVREQVTFALSVSSDPGATPEMIRMAHADQSARVRGQALFWLAQKAGKKAEAAIIGAIQDDPDTEVKKKAVFALSQMPKDEGVPKLIEVAQSNKNPEVRKQAMFWLGQSQDPRALAFFEEILAK